MNKGRFTNKLAVAAIGLGLGTLLAAAPAFAQGTSPTVNQLSLSPSTVAPGGSVQAVTACPEAVDGAALTWEHGSVLLNRGDTPDHVTYEGTLHVPANTPHGTYQVDGPCAFAFLVVGPGGVGPRGGTGLDTDNGTLLAAGAGTLAAAGLGAGGFWLLRRRREADAPVA